MTHYQAFPVMKAPTIDRKSIEEASSGGGDTTCSTLLLKSEQPASITVRAYGHPRPRISWFVGRGRAIQTDELGEPVLSANGSDVKCYRYCLNVDHVTDDWERDGLTIVATNEAGSDHFKMAVRTYKVLSGKSSTDLNTKQRDFRQHVSHDVTTSSNSSSGFVSSTKSQSQTPTSTMKKRKDLLTFNSLTSADWANWHKEMEERSRMRSIDDIIGSDHDDDEVTTVEDVEDQQFHTTPEIVPNSCQLDLDSVEYLRSTSTLTADSSIIPSSTSGIPNVTSYRAPVYVSGCGLPDRTSHPISGNENGRVTKFPDVEGGYRISSSRLPSDKLESSPSSSCVDEDHVWQLLGRKLSEVCQRLLNTDMHPSSEVAPPQTQYGTTFIDARPFQEPDVTSASIVADRNVFPVVVRQQLPPTDDLPYQPVATTSLVTTELMSDKSTGVMTAGLSSMCTSGDSLLQPADGRKARPPVPRKPVLPGGGARFSSSPVGSSQPVRRTPPPVAPKPVLPSKPPIGKKPIVATLKNCVEGSSTRGLTVGRSASSPDPCIQSACVDLARPRSLGGNSRESIEELVADVLVRDTPVNNEIRSLKTSFDVTNESRVTDEMCVVVDRQGPTVNFRFTGIERQQSKNTCESAEDVHDDIEFRQSSRSLRRSKSESTQENHHRLVRSQSPVSLTTEESPQDERPCQVLAEHDTSDMRRPKSATIRCDVGSTELASQDAAKFLPKSLRSSMSGSLCSIGRKTISREIVTVTTTEEEIITVLSTPELEEHYRALKIFSGFDSGGLKSEVRTSTSSKRSRSCGRPKGSTFTQSMMATSSEEGIISEYTTSPSIRLGHSESRVKDVTKADVDPYSNGPSRTTLPPPPPPPPHISASVAYCRPSSDYKPEVRAAETAQSTSTSSTAMLDKLIDKLTEIAFAAAADESQGNPAMPSIGDESMTSASGTGVRVRRENHGRCSRDSGAVQAASY